MNYNNVCQVTYQQVFRSNSTIRVQDQKVYGKAVGLS